MRSAVDGRSSGIVSPISPKGLTPSGEATTGIRVSTAELITALRVLVETAESAAKSIDAAFVRGGRGGSPQTLRAKSNRLLSDAAYGRDLLTRYQDQHEGKHE